MEGGVSLKCDWATPVTPEEMVFQLNLEGETEVTFLSDERCAEHF